MSKLKTILIICVATLGILLLVGAFTATGDSIWARIGYFLIGAGLILSIFSTTVRWLSLLTAALTGIIYSTVCFFAYSSISPFTYIVIIIVALTIVIYYAQRLWRRLSKNFDSARKRVDRILADYPGVEELHSEEYKQSLIDYIEGAEAIGDIVISSSADWQEFYRDYIAIDYLRTKVVGVTFNNDNGTSRQQIIPLCQCGDPVNLEYYTFKGAPAYAVMTKYGQIGNLSAAFADTIYNQYDQYMLVPEIKEITGGSDGYPYGCKLQIAVYQKK